MPNTSARTPPTWAAVLSNSVIIVLAVLLADTVSHGFWTRLIIMCVVAFVLAMMQQRLLPPRLGGRRGEGRQRR